MATKKQKRRGQKLRRHEYEEVWVDDEGREIDAPPDEDQPVERKAAATKARPAATRGSGGQTRVVQPPSWNRVLKRGAIFAPLMFLAVYLLQGKSDRNTAAAILQTAILMGFFLPFSYLMDRMMYRSYLRRTGAAPPAPKKKP